ncbi:MAG: asparagine synthase (glutamine-hydrolyzing) [Desulfobacterales bacterium]|nr:asparagine synthase (glutamine-hydrolyzing) [Desulfobacterales bacterium]
MCGISGIISLHPNNPVEQKSLTAMTDAIAHRGPDDQGIFITPEVGLGARRLSIIDLASGHQPISNENETMWIVFNGEIYNYQALRDLAAQKGHTFKTKSDTEVILHLYEEFGDDCLHHLSGIFAFAIWDDRKKELFVAKDKMGVKPVYYTQTKNFFVLGSEMKVLMQHPEVNREINLSSLNQYLTFEYVPTPGTILKNVFRLEAGHFLRHNTSGLKLQKYWQPDLRESEIRYPVNLEEEKEKLYTTLEGVVTEELVSDVPVGVFLSGGLDSSTVAAFMARNAGRQVNSFSIAFKETSFDESRYARKVANLLELKHHELTVDSQMVLDLIPNIANYLDEPFGDSSFIPTFILSRFASQHVKVVLGGDGSDELFAGYPTLAAHRIFSIYQKLCPEIIRTKVLPGLSRLFPVSFKDISFDFKLGRFLDGEGRPLLERHHRWLGSFTDAEKKSLIRPELHAELGNTFDPIYHQNKNYFAENDLNRVLYNDLKMYLEGDILFKVDRASMANSLEVRVPFLNRRMVDLAMNLPLNLKLNRLTGKYLLKKTMSSVLPDEIVNRPKKGFNIPIAHWLAGDLRPLLMDFMSSSRIKTQGIFNSSFIENLLQEHFTKKRDHRKLLWTLLVFQLWHQKYLE